MLRPRTGEDHADRNTEQVQCSQVAMVIKGYINSKVAVQFRIRKGGNQTGSNQIKTVPLAMAIREVLGPDTADVT